MTARRRVAEPPSGRDLGPDADPESVARSILLRRLTMAPRTEAELRDDLHSRGVPTDVAERVLARFVEVGLVDDAAYARMWVQSRHRSKGDARSVMRQQLRRKGVDDEVVEAALGEVSTDDEWARACALVRRRLASCERLEPVARTRRLVGMLQRRGYATSTAYAVVRSVAGDDIE